MKRTLLVLCCDMMRHAAYTCTMYIDDVHVWWSKLLGPSGVWLGSNKNKYKIIIKETQETKHLSRFATRCPQWGTACRLPFHGTTSRLLG